MSSAETYYEYGYCHFGILMFRLERNALDGDKNS